MVILCLIAVEDDCTTEEEIWGALSRMGVCSRREHFIYGEPRELLTQVWVQKGTWSICRYLTATLLAMSSCGVPGPMWRPASLKSWSIWTESVEVVPSPSTPYSEAVREKEGVSEPEYQPGSFQAHIKQLVVGDRKGG